MNYYSQQGEDTYVYRNYINKNVPDGIFVELGAMDGIKYSNTKFFEDTLQMKGLLIEPTIEYFKLIQNRPKCIKYKRAVNYTKQRVKFLGESATGGIVETMHENFKSAWHKDSVEYYVDGEPFSDLLHKSNLTYIDFLSIDVEGGEEIVLKTMDFTIPVYLICIELDNHNLEKDQRCRVILSNNGFIFDRRICGNEFWFNPNYYRKNILYDSSIQKQSFGHISELGNFYYIQPECINEISNNLL